MQSFSQRWLGEGYDHKYLAVAMVGSIFSNLSPFVQFVGRIMRVVEQNNRDSLLNRGVVVFHAGANVAQRWSDFRAFSEADQSYFADLLPESESVQFGADGIYERDLCGEFCGIQPVDIVSESEVAAVDLDPIGDPEVVALLQQLADKGITPELAAAGIRRIRPTRQDTCRARQQSLHEQIQKEAGSILARCKVNPNGKTLDKSYRNTDYQWVVSELNMRVNNIVSQQGGNRGNFTLDELNSAHESLKNCAVQLEAEVRNGKTKNAY